MVGIEQEGPMAQPAILVFTARGPQRILSEGGSQ
jgi:hypothetical protein